MHTLRLVDCCSSGPPSEACSDDSFTTGDIDTDTEQEDHLSLNAIVRGVSVLMRHNVSRSAINELFNTILGTKDERYDHLRRPVTDESQHEIQRLEFDCCPKNCRVFQKDDISEICDFCGSQRYLNDGRPARTWTYVPLTPRLERDISNPVTRSYLSYAKQVTPSTNHYADFPHSQACKRLREAVGKIGLNDQFLAIGGDGVVWEQRKRSQLWILYAVPFGLPPLLRYRSCRSYFLALIDCRPSFPKCFYSYLLPVVDDFKYLESGIIPSATARGFWGMGGSGGEGGK